MVKKVTLKKTLEEHNEDALYREVWEEVYTQKIMDFIRRNLKLIIAAVVFVVVAVAGMVAVRQIKKSNAMELATQFESAMDMHPSLAREALTRLAKKTHGGMGDLAMFRAYQMAMAANDQKDAIAKLESLASDGATRDFRDLAVLQLAQIKGDEMTGDEFQKMLSPLLTKRSPFYFSGLFFVAQKYLAEGNTEEAKPFLRKIVADADAPASIGAIAEMLSK